MLKLTQLDGSPQYVSPKHIQSMFTALERSNPPYLTFGRFVHLGRTSPRTRANAIKAGLKPVPAKKMAGMIRNALASSRMIQEGLWYDTVKY